MTVDDLLAVELDRVRRSLESLLGDGPPDPRAGDDLRRVLGSLSRIEPGPGRDAGSRAARGRSRVVTFRLRDEQEHATLRARARQAGITVSDYIRERVLDEENAGESGTVDGGARLDTREGANVHATVAPADHATTALTRQLVEAITFLFDFFNRNKTNLDINDEQKGRLKEIQALIRGIDHGT